MSPDKLDWMGAERIGPSQCCWHVGYQFCDLSAEISVYAENDPPGEADHRREVFGTEAALDVPMFREVP